MTNEEVAVKTSQSKGNVERASPRHKPGAQHDLYVYSKKLAAVGLR
jgi:hypothetical protein